MYLQGRSLRLRKQGRRSSPFRVAVLVVLIAAGLVVLALERQGTVQPLFQATAVPTRVPQSFADEAEAHFAAGNLKAAAVAYTQAVAGDPENLDYWVSLARIQIYGGQYEAALESAQKALLIDSNNAKSKAIYAWALDWNVVYGCRCTSLTEAESAAQLAIALDTNYAPAHAYYSEILNDAGKWSQGYTEAEVALRLDPNSLDAHRAMGYARESVGDYPGAIEAYKNALKINPNLIIIYLRIGLNYRALDPPDYQNAIFYFSKANAIDPQNIEPYLYLSRTHYQNDELGTAIQYLEQALALDPANPDIHGRLGLILFKRRNYEGAEPELRLAVEGGVVDLAGNPLYDYNGQPLLDVNGEPLEIVEENTLTVPKLPLSGPISLEYYYTYGNLLAFLQKCDPQRGAPKYLNDALLYAPDDPTVLGSFNESMAICMNGGPDIDPSTTGEGGTGATDDTLAAGAGTTTADGSASANPVAEITPTPTAP
jgi:tetratricopeptide (TPR) repeat protein